ncbi:MAG: type II toxin-antitoxin system VapC family toxin [Limisphaerales bacterium]
MLYFDTSYLVRLYTSDPGWEKVRALARTDRLACCLHGRAETVAAFHRKLREGVILGKELRILLAEFDQDSEGGAFRWLPLSPSVVQRLSSTYARLPATVAVRAADAIHLACAAEAGCGRVFSNDARLLMAAPHFGVVGENVL